MPECCCPLFFQRQSMASQRSNGESRRHYGLLADQIRALIHASRLEPGKRLPSERELANSLDVPRSRLREALLALEITGVVEIRSGSGIYVGREARARADTSRHRNPADTLRARAVLESACVTAAAARATMSALLHLEAAVSEMRAAVARGIPPIEADRRFHLLIVELEGNPVLVDLVDGLFSRGHEETPTAIGSDSMADWQCALAEHEAILRALKGCNPQAAAAAMYGHLAASRDRWLSRQSHAQAPGGKTIAAVASQIQAAAPA
jgi:GntR family transcriptional repressor for pyruvate dehydrogenase complex